MFELILLTTPFLTIFFSGNFVTAFSLIFYFKTVYFDIIFYYSKYCFSNLIAVYLESLFNYWFLLFYVPSKHWQVEFDGIFIGFPL